MVPGQDAPGTDWSKMLQPRAAFFGEKRLYKGWTMGSLPAPAMKVLSSLSSMKRRHAKSQVVRRRGTLYVICKANPKFKARQGRTKGTRLSKKGVS